MSMLKHKDEFLNMNPDSNIELLKPRKPSKGDDILGFTYINKPDEYLRRIKNEKEIYS